MIKMFLYEEPSKKGILTREKTYKELENNED